MKNSYIGYSISISIILLIACVMPSMGASKESPVLLYPKWQKYPVDSLMKMANRFDRRNSSDSALVCYNVVIDRLRNHAHTVKEQQTLSRALTNTGYIYATFFYDYTRALNFFQESLKVGQQCNYREDAAYIFLNMGGVYLSCNQMYGKNLFSPECWKYLEMAFSEGIDLRQYEVALVAFINMGQLCFDDARPGIIRGTIARLRKTQIPGDTPFLRFTRRYVDGLLEYIDGNYENAIRIFTESMKLTDSGSMHAARLELIAMGAIARSQKAAGHYNEAIATLNALINLAHNVGSFDEETLGYSELSNIYALAKDSIRSREALFQYLQKKDSTLTEHDITTLCKFPLVSELEDVKIQLNEERTRKQRIFVIACVVALFLVMSGIYTFMLVRNRRKMNVYIKELYRKNMELVRAEKTERELHDQEAESTTPAACTEAEKYASSNLTDEESRDIRSSILRIMNDTDAITAPEFTLEKLSSDIGVQPRIVSQVINQTLGKNFRSLLNEYRIKEACLRLADTEKYGSYTIEALAETVGFNSRSNFTVTFKKITGLTPAQFQRSAMAND